MARVIGAVSRNTNYEVTIKKPIDARSLVKSYTDLTLENNWLNSAGNSIAYNGMLVAVADTTDTTYNGLYFLFDPACTSALKSPDVTDETHWIKIGKTSDISEFADRVATIENELAEIKDALEALENASDVETYAYRSGFPISGKENKIYVAIDEGKTYTWFDGEFVSVGGADQTTYTVIHGGAAD